MWRRRQKEGKKWEEATEIGIPREQRKQVQGRPMLSFLSPGQHGRPAAVGIKAAGGNGGRGSGGAGDPGGFREPLCSLRMDPLSCEVIPSPL